MDTNQPINNQVNNQDQEPKQKKKPLSTTARVAIFAVVLIVIIGSINIITQARLGIFSSFLNGSVGVNTSSPDVTPLASLSTYEPLIATATVQAISTPSASLADTSESTTSKAVATANPPVATASQKAIDVAALNATSISWGHGLTVDKLNRPVNAINAQTKYGMYNADFIKSSSTKQIYLTFDEGYENGYSAKILNTLEAKNVPAVFFVTEPYAKNNPSLVRRMIDEGHVVGNHSVTHPSAGLPSQTIQAQINEIMGCHNYIKSTFGYTSYLFRFPLGKYSVQSLAIVKKLQLSQCVLELCI